MCPCPGSNLYIYHLIRSQKAPDYESGASSRFFEGQVLGMWAGFARHLTFKKMMQAQLLHLHRGMFPAWRAKVVIYFVTLKLDELATRYIPVSTTRARAGVRGFAGGACEV